MKQRAVKATYEQVEALHVPAFGEAKAYGVEGWHHCVRCGRRIRWAYLCCSECVEVARARLTALVGAEAFTRLLERRKGNHAK